MSRVKARGVLSLAPGQDEVSGKHGMICVEIRGSNFIIIEIIEMIYSLQEAF
jgi:hypothetical protein